LYSRRESRKLIENRNTRKRFVSWKGIGGQEFGDLAKVKVDNMRMQQETIMEHDDAPADSAVATATAEEAPADTAIIAITAGDGLATLFKSLGVTHVVNGGQTMNPSTQDIVDAINQSKAKRAIVLPNNKNIFLAAEQAAKVADVPAVIVHSKTVSQGMTAMLGYNPDAELDENQEAMEDNLSAVKSGQVTHAIRDTQLDGFDIKEGNFMGIVDGTIKVTDADLLTTAVDTVKAMLDDESEIITIIYGADTTAEVAEKLQAQVEALDDDLETEVHEGDQPVYPFLISVE